MFCVPTFQKFNFVYISCEPRTFVYAVIGRSTCHYVGWLHTFYRRAKSALQRDQLSSTRPNFLRNFPKLW